MVKRLALILALMVLCLLTALPALADGHPEALFAARGESGLWGYIDASGEFVIPPKYAAVSPALGSPMVSGLFMAVSDDGESWGLIDDDGDEIFPQEYVITWSDYDFAIYCADSEDRVAAWAMAHGTQKVGYFNTNYGEFSGFLWKEICLWDDGVSLMPVMDENGLWGYANSNLNYGHYETVIPCQFAEAAAFTVNGGEVYDTGWAVARYPQDENGHTEYVLVSSVDGHVVHPPEGYMLDINQPVTENKAIICSRPAFDAEGNPLPDRCGFMDTEGNILWLMEDQDVELWPYENGWCVAYSYEDGHGRYLDENGHVLDGVYARPEGMGGYRFVNGLTSVFVGDRPAAMDDEGNVLFVMEGENVFWLCNFEQNGLAWYKEWHPEAGDRWYEQEQYGLADRNGNVLTPSDFWCYNEDYGAPFSYGLAAARYAQGDNLYGYLNEQGQWAIEPRFIYAGEFQEGGLAYVKTSPTRHAYIDLEGREVYAWTYGDETLSWWQEDQPESGMEQDERIALKRILTQSTEKQ